MLIDIDVFNSANSNKKEYEHKGQKEVVLSRPATPLRRHFSDSVMEALTKTTNEIQSIQVISIDLYDFATKNKTNLCFSILKFGSMNN